MIKSYATFDGLAKYLQCYLFQAQADLLAAVTESAQLLEDKAKEKFGVYQDSEGTYPAWAQLKEATQRERVRQGYTANEPLLRDGTLKDSIHYSVTKLPKVVEAVVGTNNKIMVYQEMGTKDIPPRPVLGPTAYENAPLVLSIIENKTIKKLGITPRKRSPKSELPV